MGVYKREWKNKQGKNCFCWYFHKTIDGVRYRERIPTARTKAQAEEAEIKILNRIHEGTYGKPGGTKTLKEFVEKTFIQWAKENKRSWRSDLSRLKTILAFFGNKRLREICDNPFLIETFKSKLLKTPVVFKNKKGDITKERERSKASVNRVLQLLSRIFTLAMEKKEIKENPVSLVPLFPGERKRKRQLHREERAKLFDAIHAAGAQGKRQHLTSIILLDLNTGLRRTELLSLRVEDVDFLT